MRLNTCIDLAEHRVTVSALAERFHAAGEELYLVGGAVRDALLHRPFEELDFATSAAPETTVALLEQVALGSPYRVGEKFGTIGLARAGVRLEITTYRSEEHYVARSRKPKVSLGGTLEQDLRRRDFTVNAMAWDPRTGQLIDPLGGQDDLRAGVLRAVGTPDERFEEDPLRILRAVRFAGRLGLAIEPATFQGILTRASSLTHISRERIRDEYSRILVGPNAADSLTLMRDSGILEHSVPELLELTRLADHGPYHALSLWDHTMRVLTLVPADLTLRWAALLHDIAKPATRTFEPDGRPRFFHHEDEGARLARQILADLRYPNALVDAVVCLIATHMQLHAYGPEWSDGAVRRLILRLGDLTDDALALSRADAAGHSLSGLPATAGGRADQLARRIVELGQHATRALKSPLSGTDLMARYQRPPGPWIARVKDALESEMLDGHLSPDDLDTAWAIADRLAAEAKQ